MQRTTRTKDDQPLESDLAKIFNRRCNPSLPDADLRHLFKLQLWGRLCTILGYATAWLLPNPISAFLISQGIFTRWTIIAHPVLHGAYDSISNVPRWLNSQHFAKGWRRYIDWCDWIHPEAWSHEHNRLHHYNLGEHSDPDQLQHNMRWLRRSRSPLWLRYILIASFACIWKAAYYAPKTLLEIKKHQNSKTGIKSPQTFLTFDAWSLRSSHGRELWLRYLLPYAGFRFALLPSLFFPLGSQAVIYVFITSCIAEVMTNIHSFIVIVPNHAGDDVPLFESKIKNREDFLYRQIVGSVNYRTGGDLNDFMHGWLNYQIEHHLWPRLPLKQYQEIQEDVRDLCIRRGIPYRQEPVLKRLIKALQVMVGSRSMRPEDRPRFVTSTALTSQVVSPAGASIRSSAR